MGDEITPGINFQKDQNVPVYNLEPENIFLQKEGDRNISLKRTKCLTWKGSTQVASTHLYLPKTDTRIHRLSYRVPFCGVSLKNDIIHTEIYSECWERGRGWINTAQGSGRVKREAGFSEFANLLFFLHRWIKGVGKTLNLSKKCIG